MLDKSIEFHSIIMRHPNSKEIVEPSIPKGFSVRFYERGDEKYWALIQTAVQEFDSIDDALECFQHYLHHEEELHRRQIYIVDNEKGVPVATATAWFSEYGGKPIGVVHAFSCLPEYQSLGLGRIAAIYMMKCFHECMPDSEVWLDTQTWSYRAIGIYLELGFIPMKTAVYNEVPNEFQEAVQVLKGKMRADIYQKFIESAK